MKKEEISKPEKVENSPFLDSGPFWQGKRSNLLKTQVIKYNTLLKTQVMKYNTLLKTQVINIAF